MLRSILFGQMGLFGHMGALVKTMRRPLTSVLLGLGVWLALPSSFAIQDIAALISDHETSTGRWIFFLSNPPTCSEHAAEIVRADPALNGIIADISATFPKAGRIGVRGSSGFEVAGSDEGRVTRDQKRGRVVSVATHSPSRTFTAGLIPGSKELPLRPAFDAPPKSAFGDDFKGRRGPAIATAFHNKLVDRYAGVPPVLRKLVTNDKADVLATAYAPTDPFHEETSPFAALLDGDSDASGRFVPPVTEGDHDWMRRPLPEVVFSKPEQECLSTAVYFEARGESPKGQAAVAQVILNRVRNPSYPNTICGVVYQNEDWSNRCQFSFACDGVPDRIANRRAYRLAREVALAVTAGKIFLRDVASSTHYYATYVNPSWASAMEKMTQIGSHLFFRTYGGGWG